MEGKIKNISLVVICLIVGMVIGAGSLFTWNSYMAKDPSKLASQMEQAQVKQLMEKISKLIILPVDEEPFLMKIDDAAALAKDQVFYKGSSNGDVVLVYQKASKAIIYSPSKNIIVNVGPIFLQDQQVQTPAKATASTTKK